MARIERRWVPRSWVAVLPARLSCEPRRAATLHGLVARLRAKTRRPRARRARPVEARGASVPIERAPNAGFGLFPGHWSHFARLDGLEAASNLRVPVVAQRDLVRDQAVAESHDELLSFGCRERERLVQKPLGGGGHLLILALRAPGHHSVEPWPSGLPQRRAGPRRPRPGGPGHRARRLRGPHGLRRPGDPCAGPTGHRRGRGPRTRHGVGRSFGHDARMGHASRHCQSRAELRRAIRRAFRPLPPADRRQSAGARQCHTRLQGSPDVATNHPHARRGACLRGRIRCPHVLRRRPSLPRGSRVAGSGA